MSSMVGGFELLGYPERYRMNDSLMFDTTYHLSKKGVDLRTQLLIEDIKKSIKNFFDLKSMK